MALTAAVGLLAPGFALPPAVPAARTARRRADLRALATNPAGGYSSAAFSLSVDFEDGTTVQARLPPHYSSSRLLLVRLSLPLLLSVEPRMGAMQITKDGRGLLAGDVLRACSTFSWEPRRVFGLIPGGLKPMKSLFVADGCPHKQVVEALAANTEDKTSDILLIVERPAVREDGDVLHAPGEDPASPLFWL